VHHGKKRHQINGDSFAFESFVRIHFCHFFFANPKNALKIREIMLEIAKYLLLV